MAVPRTRYELFGQVGSGADVWSCGFVGGDSSALSDGQLLANAEHVYDDFVLEVWDHASTDDFWSSQTTLNGCRLRVIDGSNVTTRVATFTAGSPNPGASGQHQLPGEVAEVVTLLSATAGGTGRGRMYLPPLHAGKVYADGVMASGDQVDLVDAMQRFFVDLNARPSNEFPGVVSMYSNTASALRTVVTIRLGNVFDSQRRRRNTQLENYEARTL